MNLNDFLEDFVWQYLTQKSFRQFIHLKAIISLSKTNQQIFFMNLNLYLF